MGKTVESTKQRKKKGRPSLLDLQKRSLRLQSKPKPNPNPTPNTNPNPNLRRSTRRNPAPSSSSDEDDDAYGGRRREKKLKLVLRLPQHQLGGGAPGSDSDGEGKGAIEGSEGEGVDKVEVQEVAVVKAAKGESMDAEPATPLPDNKLLVFILDRLQKKDTYGVFSDPVDPEELPDYHDIIDHPMDFSTIREKLSSGAYASLEQFEEDVLLISLNAMRYNSPDTIYFRQARSIHELAKKDFENLRQESDGNEPEPKVVRRGRPPSKNIFKKLLNRPSSDLSSPNTPGRAVNANSTDKAHSSNDVVRKGTASDKPAVDPPARFSLASRNGENYSWLTEKKSERNDDYSGSVMKGMSGFSTRYGKKPMVSEENRRNTYMQAPVALNGQEPSILTTFDTEKKELIPIGLNMEHAYARSLARFAADLGPVGWEIAAKKIERALPPGTKFGRGWVGKKDSPQLRQPSLSSSSISPQIVVPPAFSMTKADQPPQRIESSNIIAAVGLNPNQPSSSSVTVTSNRANPAENTETSKVSTFESNIISSPSGGSIRPKAPFQQQEKSPVEPTVNGFNTGFAFSLSQIAQMAGPSRPSASLAPDMLMSHARALDMVSRTNSNIIRPAATGHSEPDRTKMCNPTILNAGSNFFHQVASNPLSTERTKMGSTSSLNFTNNYSHPSTLNHVDGERAKSTNLNAANLSNRHIQQTTAVQPDAERPKSGNPSVPDSNNSSMHPEPTGQLEAPRAVISNPSTINSGNSSHRSGAGRADVHTTESENPKAIASTSPLPESSQNNSQGFWRELSLHQKEDSTPPDLNVRFQSPGSPASTAVIDSKQPDLALQL